MRGVRGFSINVLDLLLVVRGVGRFRGLEFSIYVLYLLLVMSGVGGFRGLGFSIYVLNL